MSVKSFVETLNIKNANKLTIYLDSKIYPNEFGISVRPLQVRYDNSIIDMKQLIDIFGKIPYISVKENRYRSVYRDPMIMTIDLNPKQYKDNTYYEYYIEKLCLRSELRKYEIIYNKAHESIKEFKKSNINCVNSDDNIQIQSIDSYLNNDIPV